MSGPGAPWARTIHPRAVSVLLGLAGFAMVAVSVPRSLRAAGPPVPRGASKLPPTAARYLAALAQVPAATVEIALTPPPGSTAPSRTATLAFARPNRYKLTVREANRAIETTVSDGKTLRQWSAAGTRDEPAPATLNGIASWLPVSHEAFWGTAALTMPEMIASLRDLREEGLSSIGGKTARKLRGKLHYGEDPGMVNVWVDQTSGLPVRVDFEHKERMATLSFTAFTVGPPIAGTFDQRPPDGLPPLPADPSFPALTVGSPAPDFQLATAAGQPISLRSQRGHVVLVEFWAPWCPGCRLAAPTVNKVSAELHPRGLRSILVSTTAERWELTDYLEERRVWGHAVHDPGDETDAVGYSRYKITGFPSFVVVDAHGRIAATWKGYFEGAFEVRLRAALNRTMR